MASSWWATISTEELRLAADGDVHPGTHEAAVHHRPRPRSAGVAVGSRSWAVDVIMPGPQSRSRSPSATASTAATQDGRHRHRDRDQRRALHAGPPRRVLLLPSMRRIRAVGQRRAPRASVPEVPPPGASWCRSRTCAGMRAERSGFPAHVRSHGGGSGGRFPAQVRREGHEDRRESCAGAQERRRHRTEEVVEPRGLEPLTPCLQSRCATNCAKAPGSAREGR